MIRPRAEQQGIRLSTNLDSQLGTVEADERKFKQVLFNLLSNAVKFTPSGKSIDVKVLNEDATIHNFAMFTDSAMSDVVFRGDTFSGPGATMDYLFTAPKPGTYFFHCDVHPVMNGTVKVT